MSINSFNFVIIKLKEWYLGMQRAFLCGIIVISATSGDNSAIAVGGIILKGAGKSPLKFSNFILSNIEKSCVVYGK